MIHLEGFQKRKVLNYLCVIVLKLRIVRGFGECFINRFECVIERLDGALKIAFDHKFGAANLQKPHGNIMLYASVS